MAEDILFERRGTVAIITINRPEQRNSINTGVRQGLFDAFARFEQDASLLVAILTGVGEKAFCAGMDLKEAAASMLGVPPRNFLPILGDAIQVSNDLLKIKGKSKTIPVYFFSRCCY